MIKQVFNIADIARMLKVTEGTIANCIKRGELSAVKASRWKIRFSDAANFVLVKSRIKWGRK